MSLQVEGIPIIFVSAIEGKGRAAIMRKVFESYERWNARLPTARLNNWLQKVTFAFIYAHTFGQKALKYPSDMLA